MENHFQKNRIAWNTKTGINIQSEFYDNESFLKGRNTLNQIELSLLDDVKEKSILHLQCHFGQDTISLARMGAIVTAVDFSEKAISAAEKFAEQLKIGAKFICCNLYDLPKYLHDSYDIVFTTYGTIGWLPDIEAWARIISTYLKPGGSLVFAEFHPVVWMFDDNFQKIAYRYFNNGPIHEISQGSYADRNVPISIETVGWNHSIGEVLTALLKNGMEINTFEEYDYSPANCFAGCIEAEPGKFRIRHLDDKIPMVYSFTATKKIPISA